MAVYDRRRLAASINFLSRISIDAQGFSLNFGRKIFTGFEMLDLENYFHIFPLVRCIKCQKKKLLLKVAFSQKELRGKVDEKSEKGAILKTLSRKSHLFCLIGL